MTDAAWESLSNQAVAAAGLLYFLALLAHLVEWASLRKVPVAAGAAARDSIDIPGGVAVATGPDERARPRTGPGVRRSSAGSATCSPASRSPCTFVALFARGMAADPNRVPWGNMYEFTLTGTFVVAFLYVVLYRKFRLAWMAPIVLAFVLTILMVAVIWLYAPVAPLTEALVVVLAGDPRRLRDHRDRRLHPRRHHLGALPGQGARASPRAAGSRPATSPGCRSPRCSTGSPTGCTPSASRCGPSRC